MMFGSNENGQLGVGGGMNSSNFPLSLIFVECSSAVSVSCGFSHSLILMSDGSVRSFGYNSYGQLGLGTTVDQTTPQTLGWVGWPVIGIATGGYHSMILIGDGTLMSFGRNEEGQLGLGDLMNRNIPTSISLLKGLRVFDLKGGMFHSVISLGSMISTFGLNSDGQLGSSNVVGNYTSTPTMVFFEDFDVTELVVGSHFSIVKVVNGSFESFGRNLCGELGLGFTSSNEKIPTIMNSLIDIISSSNSSNSSSNNIIFGPVCSIPSSNSSNGTYQFLYPVTSSSSVTAVTCSCDCSSSGGSGCCQSGSC